MAITNAQTIIHENTTHPLPLDLNGSNFTYPFPLSLYSIPSQHQNLSMAFMDISPPTNISNGQTAVLLHGKNFCGATWNSTAHALVSAGYRVILPDQIGFCKSSKPVGYQFTLHQLASNTRGLLEELGVQKSTVIGHSMGGMLATRYALLFPENVEKLVLVNPIGLEDWLALGVPYQTIDTTVVSEAASNYTSIRAYEQETYYPNTTWRPEFDVWVTMLANIYKGSEAERFIYNQAQTVDMVLTQPVVYNFKDLEMRTLLMIGRRDNTAIGKQWSPKEVRERLGKYDVLGRETVGKIKRGELVEWEDLGHAPQIQDPERFEEALVGWLGER